MDGNPAAADGTRRDAALDAGRNRNEQSGHWPTRSGLGNVQSLATFPRGPERSAAPYRYVRFAGPDRSRQDPPGQDAGRAVVWRFQSADPVGYERVHGEIQCLAADWFAARLRGLRGRRATDRAGQAQTLLGGSLR